MGKIQDAMKQCGVDMSDLRDRMLAKCGGPLRKSTELNKRFLYVYDKLWKLKYHTLSEFNIIHLNMLFLFSECMRQMQQRGEEMRETMKNLKDYMEDQNGGGPLMCRCQ